MQIILKQDVNGLGYEYDVINVKPGYARNFLIPRGLATPATPSALKVRNEVVKQKAHKEEKKINDANELAKALEKVVLKFEMKAQDSGKTYGSVTTAMIAEAIKTQYNYDIDKDDVLLNDNIKEIGEYHVKIRVFKNIQPHVRVLVAKEETEEERAAAKARAEEKKAEEKKKVEENAVEEAHDEQKKSED